jgi:hypothetical protein
MMAVYCLTGRDTCSSFFGIGKRAAFKIMVQKAESFQALASLARVNCQKLLRWPVLNSLVSCTESVTAIH